MAVDSIFPLENKFIEKQYHHQQCSTGFQLEGSFKNMEYRSADKHGFTIIIKIRRISGQKGGIDFTCHRFRPNARNIE